MFFVLSPPEESEHSSTKAHSVILKSSATHPEVKTIEPCSSNQISKPTSQYSDDNDDSQTETLQDALSRAELYQTLRKSATGKAEKRAKTEAELAAARAEWEMNAEPNWTDTDEVLATVSRNGMDLKNACTALRETKRVVLAACARNGAVS